MPEIDWPDLIGFLMACQFNYWLGWWVGRNFGRSKK